MTTRFCYCWMPAMLMVGFVMCHPVAGQMPSMPSMGGLTKGPQASGQASGLGAGLSDAQIGSGLKEALAVGTKKAVTLVSAPGGYLDNAAIKILLPKNLQPVEKALRGMGQGDKIDGFVASMNHAAESAAPEAAGIFGDAVKEMTIEDARKLLNGGDTSITEYFKSKTSEKLAAAFRPHVEEAMKTTGVTEKYAALQGSAPKMPFGMGGSSGGFDINTYVVNGALNGLFYMLGQEEKEIRTNPAARTTGLLKSVFGK
jgi:hypothetical protein